MEIFVPDTIKAYEPELRLVFDLMVAKLNMNRHKGFGESSDYHSLMQGLVSEMDELDHSMRERDQMSTVVEAVDVANFGVLAAIMVLRRTKAEYKIMQLEAGKNAARKAT